MVRITWENETLHVRRVVVRRDLPRAYTYAVRRAAERLGLPLAYPEAKPRAGDFWLACSPDRGWGDADPGAIGWVSPLDIDAGLNLLFATIEAVKLHPVP
ncbi:hypothetical protein [Limnoglobus roseus]|uniref:Uncharacterized protein n=1 Tax=Limnoglobus roseus TaxID=2598579 RepID=A0A5C1ADN1_9BACT|nr:hypothetical protein [Limnoglobus roseus]QEL16343.1 hypothetical protein PX52LOC_03289 [Limnoglobus roseus]